MKTKKSSLERQYVLYMGVINRIIKDTEQQIKDLPKRVEISKMSFGDWCKWQNK